MTIRKLEWAEMDAAAAVHRTALHDQFPWLAGLHTPEQDGCYYRERVFPACQI